MSIDPDELKERRAKREAQIHQVQNYMIEQDNVDKQSKPGKMGAHDVKKEEGISQKIKNITEHSLLFLKKAH